MPVEFLTDDQAAAYGRFSGPLGPLSRVDLERCFSLDDADRSLVEARRGASNRLGLAIQLGTVRLLGTFLADPLDVPTEAVDFVAGQLEITDASCLKGYAKREKTRLEHQWDIARVHGYSDFGAAEADLATWVGNRAWTTGDGPKSLFVGAVGWLRERRVLLPGVSVLARLVARVRDAAMQRLWDVLAAMVTPEQAARAPRSPGSGRCRAARRRRCCTRPR